MRAGRGRVGVLDNLRGTGKGTTPWSQNTCQAKTHGTVVVAPWWWRAAATQNTNPST